MAGRPRRGITVWRSLATAGLLAIGLAGTAAAETIGYADAIKILATTCGADIEKVCPKAQLANFEIGRCLQENQAKVSPQCTTSLVRVGQSLQARAAAQASVSKLCATDVQRLCPPKLMKPGDGHLLVCLLKAQPSVSKRCNAAITDAGYR